MERIQRIRRERERDEETDRRGREMGGGRRMEREKKEKK